VIVAKTLLNFKIVFHYYYFKKKKQYSFMLDAVIHHTVYASLWAEVRRMYTTVGRHPTTSKRYTSRELKMALIDFPFQCSQLRLNPLAST